MNDSVNQTGVLAIERNSIGYVNAGQRHGKPGDLFTLWFCTNIAPLAVISGAAAILVFKLDLLSAMLAIAAGHLFGGVFHALTSAQGPLVGIPQMIQSRAQFGRYGSLLVVGFTTLIYLGFFVSNIILSGQTLHTVVPAIPVSVATVAGAIAATLIGVIGYNLIHRFNKVGAWFMGGALLIGMALMIPGIDAQTFAHGEFSLTNGFAVFGLGAVWQISFAPYTSDYSRYLPASSGFWRTFACTYLGASLGTIFAFLFGAIAVSTGGDSDAMQAVQARTGEFGHILIVLFLINIVGHNGMNLYGAVLSFMTAAQTFLPDWLPGRGVRVATAAALLLLSTATALWASSHFIQLFLSAIFALLLVLVPWVAINLVDFYLISGRHYQVADIIRNDGGLYGAFNAKAMTAYVLGILIQFPFVENTFYHGAWAGVAGGADISWLIGLAGTATAYYALSRQRGYLAPLALDND